MLKILGIMRKAARSTTDEDDVDCALLKVAHHCSVLIFNSMSSVGWISN